jgi:micrococcal nuclease
MLNKKQRQLILSSLFSLLVLLIGSWLFPDQDWFGDQLESQVVGTATAPTAVAVNVPADSTDLHQVVQVVDGDTIKVMLNGEKVTVRLANINTPESVDPRREVECLGKEAGEHLTFLSANQSVRLLPDETQSPKDRYGRLIRFAQLADGRDLGLLMIEAGFAHSTPYGRGEHKYYSQYETAQRQAESQKKGLWADEACRAE